MATLGGTPNEMVRPAFLTWLPMLLVAGGVMATATGLLARACLNPNASHGTASRYDVVTSETAQSHSFSLTRRGRDAASLVGSTDTMCEMPYTLWIDVNGDGVRDLYFHECGGTDTCAATRKQWSLST